MALDFRPRRLTRAERARLGFKRRVVSDSFLEKLEKTFKKLGVISKRRTRHKRKR
jgi:hypothetical protein